MNSEQKPKFFFEPLDRQRHDRTAFSCGNTWLDDYLKKQASQDSEKRVAAVMVLTPDGKKIAGYYTLSQHAVDQVRLPPNLLKRLKLPRYPQLPSTLLGRLARSIEFKNAGLGDLLVTGALQLALQMSRSVASMAVVVDAIDDRARSFYLGYGFVPLVDNPRGMLLPMATVAELFGVRQQTKISSESKPKL